MTTTTNTAQVIPNKLNLHGKVIKYKQIDTLIPDRNAFLESTIYTEINQKIKKGENLFFMPSGLHEINTQSAKYEKATYKIILFGTLVDGRRISVMLTDIQPYFDIMVPSKSDNITFAEGIMTELKSQYCDRKYNGETKHQLIYDPIKYDIIKAKPFKKYQAKKSSYIRIYFNKTTQRAAAIKFIRQKGYETASDDISCYHRVVARNHMIPLANWVILKSYEVTKHDLIKGPVFKVSISNYVKYEGDILNDPLLSKDKLMEFCWDIETYSPDGDLPLPNHKNDKVFMISMTFGWYWAKDPFFKICLVDMPCNPDPNKGYLTIICGTEEKLIRAFAQIYNKLRPEFNEGFNDSDYDWSWIIKRAAKYDNLLSYIATCFDASNPWKPYQDDDVYDEETWNSEHPKKRLLFKRESIKLEADSNATSSTLILPGYINIDVRTVFRQLYPTAEKSSLSWFLATNKLGGKEDMPYQELFRIYREFCDMRQKIVDTLLKLTPINDEQKDDLPNLLKQITKNKNKIHDDVLNDIIDTIKNLKKKMAQVASYCVVDAQRCHDLMNMRSVIRDKREVSDLSYTTLFDAFYRANGMKVRNLVIAHGQKRDLLFSNVNDKEVVDEGKYPGAYVIPPKKGLSTTKLTIEERIEKYARFAAGEKLHDCEQLQEWTQLSSDKIQHYKDLIKENGAILTEKKIQALNKIELESTGEQLATCFKLFLSEQIGRPITGLDFASLYPSLIMTYNLSPEYVIIDQKQAKEMYANGSKLHKISFEFGGRTIRGWSIKHENKIDSSQKDCKFGVYPMILKQLFDSRAALKVDLARYAKEKEDLTTKGCEETEDYAEANFKYNYYDSKQKALKVFMNTFYGEAGNKRSPFFLLQVAGGITTAGQRNIKMAKSFVEGLGCYVHYGDTDSLYVSAPDIEFQNLDKTYYSGGLTKLDYWTEMVKHTFTSIRDVQNQVNNMFIKDNGTKFLKMAFEEVCYPMCLCAKKKYFCKAHEHDDHISFEIKSIKDIFLRGLDIKKRGVSELAKKVVTDILKTCMHPDNILTLVELVEQKIRTIYKQKWEFDDFIMTDVYKPKKKNIKVLTFASRMENEGRPIKPYDRFNYVIVKKYPFYYDFRGRKIELSIGDKMELYTYAKSQNLPIDFDYYMNGSINGQLARLIVYHPQFHVDPAADGEEEMKIAETKEYNEACKYIGSACAPYYTTYKSKGPIYQRIFREANTLIGDKLQRYHKDPTIIKLLKSCCDTEDIEGWLCKKAESEANRLTKNYGETYIDEQLEKVTLDDEIKQKIDTVYGSSENITEDDKKKRKAALAKAKKDAKSKKLNELQKTYYGGSYNILKTKEKDFKDRITILQRKIKDNLSNILKIHEAHSTMVIQISDVIKRTLDIDNKYNEPDAKIPKYDELDTVKSSSSTADEKVLNIEAEQIVNKFAKNTTFKSYLNELKLIYASLISTYELMYKTKSIVNYLKSLKTTKIVEAPISISNLVLELTQSTMNETK